MTKIKKDFKLKLIYILTTVLFFFNSAVYGMDLPLVTHLRAPIQKAVYEDMQDIINVIEMADIMIKIRRAAKKAFEENGRQVICFFYQGAVSKEDLNKLKSAAKNLDGELAVSTVTPEQRKEAYSLLGVSIEKISDSLTGFDGSVRACDRIWRAYSHFREYCKERLSQNLTYMDKIAFDTLWKYIANPVAEIDPHGNGKKKLREVIGDEKPRIEKILGWLKGEGEATVVIVKLPVVRDRGLIGAVHGTLDVDTISTNLKSLQNDI